MVTRVSGGLGETNKMRFVTRIVVAQSLSPVWLFATPRTWTAAPGLPGLRHLPELAHTHVPWVRDAIQPSHLLSSPSPPALNLSQHQMSQLFTRSGRSIRASASASILLMNIQDLFPLGLTGLVSLQSKGLSRVSSNNTVQKYQFFGTHPLWSSSHIHT